MSSRIFQSVIMQMRDATKRLIGVIDSEGTVVASSELSMVGENSGIVQLAPDETSGGVVKIDGRTYKPLSGTGSRYECAVFSEGEDDFARTICVMAGIAISEAKMYFEENHDKSAFIKNIISDNILPGDIYVRAKDLHFIMDTPRVVFVIRRAGAIDISALEVLQDMFPDKQRDFTISVSETDIALIKEMTANSDMKQQTKLAEEIEARLLRDLGVRVVIGISTPSKHLRDLADKFKEAQVAIDIGKVFDADKTITSYESLGIGRLIYQLPTTLCEIFLSEVFKKNPIEALDQETLFTIDKFFENSLNVSETSRKLFVHRNTLVYRLEKIKKITGLDLREFDHAIVFKVALMVKKYLVSQESRF